jgi:hypothetical protein
MTTGINEDHSVGYCHPPKHTQFKPGQSGNPKGCPRGRRKKVNLGNLKAAFTDPVTIKVRGKKITVPALEALCWQSVNEAFSKGDTKSLQHALKLANELGLIEEARRPEPIEKTEVMRHFMGSMFKDSRRRRWIAENGMFPEGRDAPDLPTRIP